MPYKIKRSKSFATDEAKLKKAFERFHLALEGIEAALASDPTQFPVEYVDYKVRCVPTGDWPGMPMVNIYYTVWRDEVTLQWLQVHEGDPNGDSGK